MFAVRNRQPQLPEFRSLLPCTWPNRSNRVNLLMFLVVIMSLVDLYMTLQQMTNQGMFEGNPLVVLLVQWTNSSVGIAIYKALTILIAVGLILRLRLYASAELGAWFMMLVLVLLIIQWVRYIAFFDTLDPVIIEQLRNQSGWVIIGEGV